MGPLPSVGQGTLACLVFCFLCHMVFAYFEDNALVKLSYHSARLLNVSDCWVCTLMPSGAEMGLPMIPVNVTAPTYLMVPPTKGEWCWLCNGSGPFLGRSQCNHTLLSVGRWDKNGSSKVWVNQSSLSELWWTTWNQTFHDFVHCEKDVNNWRCLWLTIRKTGVVSNFDGYYARFVDTYLTKGCNIAFPALVGHHWVCGNRAYCVLPRNWSGCCYPALLLPPIKIYKTFPHKRLQNYRDILDAQDIIKKNQPLTWSFLGFRGLVKLTNSLIRLQAVVEILANDTGESLQLLATEQQALRKMTVQNRLALDIVLASKGGVCGLINQECCVYVPDVADQVIDRAQQLEKVSYVPPQPPPTAWWSALWSWLPSLGWIREAIIGLLCFLLVGVMLCCCFQCLGNLPAVCSAFLHWSKPKAATLQLLTLSEVQEIRCKLDAKYKPQGEPMKSGALIGSKGGV
uniref:Envelope protein syncytin-Car1 n=1 Tax=Chelydra serpentina TaxID=8475 RepID=A0A8C3RM68_CHESE